MSVISSTPGRKWNNDFIEILETIIEEPVELETITLGEVATLVGAALLEIKVPFEDINYTFKLADRFTPEEIMELRLKVGI